MSNVKISQLPAATTPLAGTEVLPLVQGTTTAKVTVAQLRATSVTAVTGTAPVVSSGGLTPAISMAAANTSTNGYLTSTDWNTFNGKGSGTVTGVTATSPVVSSGGTAPVISMPAASTSASGYLTSTDWNTFNGKYSTGGALGTPSSGTATNLTGLPLTTGVTGTLPVANGGTGTTTPSLVAGTNVTVSGTWPNQTVNATASGSGTVTSVAATVPAFLAVTGSPITTSGTLAIAYSGTALPVLNGGTGTTTPALVAGTNVTITGTWPNQTINSSGGGSMVYPGAGIGNSTGTAWGTSYSTTGTGTVVALATSPTFVTPVLGTPASGVATNLTGLPLTTGVTGTLPVLNGGTGQTTAAAAITALTGTQTSAYYLRSNGTNSVLAALAAADVTGTLAVANGGTGVTTSTGTGAVVLSTSPTLVTPLLGTPTSGVATNLTGLPLTTGVTGTLPVANGGTGTTTPALVAGTNVTITGTWPNQTINSSGSGGGVTSFSAGTTGFTPSTATTGVVTLAGTLAVANGGTGVTTSTGSGNTVLSTSPTLVTPILGVATATSLQGIIGNVTPATGAFTSITASSTITPSQTAGIVGTTTNNNANAGSVGEVVSSSVAVGSAVSLTTASGAFTGKTITSISLTAGDWDVFGTIGINNASTTNFTVVGGGVNTVTDTLNSAYEEETRFSYGAAGVVLNNVVTFTFPTTRVSVASTTTYYLIAYAQFSVSTATAFGRITARRMR